MDLFKKLIFVLFCVFILALFIWALYIPKEDVSTIIKETLKDQENRSDLFYKNVTFKEISDGVKYWEINAKTSTLNSSKNVADLKDTNGTFYEKGQPTLKFIAPAALWKMDKKIITLTNALGFDAQASRSKLASMLADKTKADSYFELPQKYTGKGNGFFFKANNLVWQMSDKKLVCDQGISLKKGNIRGTAQKLSGDVGLEKVMIEGSPKIRIEDGITALLTAEIFIVDSKNDRLSAINEVNLLANDIKVTTHTATYEQNANIVKLNGNVKAVYKGFTAESPYGIYYIKGQKMILSGGAKLTRGESVVTGNRVSVDIKSRTFSIKGKSKIVIPEEEMTKEAI